MFDRTNLPDIVFKKTQFKVPYGQRDLSASTQSISILLEAAIKRAFKDLPPIHVYHKDSVVADIPPFLPAFDESTQEEDTEKRDLEEKLNEVHGEFFPSLDLGEASLSDSFEEIELDNAIESDNESEAAASAGQFQFVSPSIESMSPSPKEIAFKRGRRNAIENINGSHLFALDKEPKLLSFSKENVSPIEKIKALGYQSNALATSLELQKTLKAEAERNKVKTPKKVRFNIPLR